MKTERPREEVATTEAADAPLEDRELLAELVRALVDEPIEVQVVERYVPDSDTATLMIHCAPEDRGKVIGRHGATIKSLRYLFAAIGAVDGRRVSVQVSERNA